MNKNKTTFIKKEDTKSKKWYLIDCSNQILGRLSTRVADILRGKNKNIYTPNVDTGDYVILINSNKIRVTGKKLEDKKYYYHSGYFGGLKERNLKYMMDKDSTKVLFESIKNMLPKNKLQDKYLKKLKIYTNEKHPHLSNNPIILD